MHFSVCLATFDDFDGTLFSCQSLLIHHRQWVNDIVIVNNNPGDEAGKMLAAYAAKHPGLVAYHELGGMTGTARPRNEAIRLAKGEYVVGLDCHVLLHPGALQALSEFYAADPGSKDLLHGPLIYDDNQTVSTHFQDIWEQQMWGKWGSDIRCAYEKWFEIKAQGFGLFATRKDAWLPFHEKMTGFGGEEWCHHELYRKEGRKVWCVSGLKWWHRFGRVGGPKYPNRTPERIRNYVVQHLDYGIPTDRLREHFKLDDKTWDGYVASAKAEMSQVMPQVLGMPGGECGSCYPRDWNIDQWYQKAADEKSDINEHVPTLKALATGCKTVVEFGVRTGVSTAALLAGRPKLLVSYDLNDSPQARALAKPAKEAGVRFEFYRGSSIEVTIPPCDLLLIDSRHTADHCWKELCRHKDKVRDSIVFHDTDKATFGERGEDGGPGLMHAIRRFLSENPEWQTIRHDTNNHGLTVISRNKDKHTPNLPNFLTLGINYAKHKARELLNPGKVPLEIAEARYEVCKSKGGRCPSGFRNIDTDRCSECGCHLNERQTASGESAGPMTGKIWDRASFCPVGHWHAMKDEPSEATEVKAHA